jgi:hypothetical protein
VPSEGRVFRVRTRVSSGGYARSLGRTNKQTVSSRTAKTQDKTNTTNTRTDVGRLMTEAIITIIGIVVVLYILEKTLKDY